MAKCYHKRLLISASLLLLLTLFLAACSSGGGSNNPTPTPGTGKGSTPTTGTNATPTASLTPGVGLGPRPCPDAVKDPAHWDPIIGTQANVTKVEKVICGNLIGNPALQASVTVRYTGTGAILDFYVYSKITQPNPTQLFKLQGLYKGDAKISGYNTVLTAEVDQNSSINKNKPNAEFQQDLFREFKWSDGAGTLVPVAFGGIFPDLTRYQAESDQAKVNQGEDPWKLSAATVSMRLATDLLQWPSNAQTTVVSGGGKSDLNAVVNVVSAGPPSVSIKVSLIRLEGNTNGGIWIVTSVESPNMSITAPQSLDRLTSPTTVTGKGNAFEGVIGTVKILDHLYSDIGHAQAKGAIGNGNTTFSTNVSYSSSFHGGAQEGLVVLLAANSAGGPSPAVIVKELISA